jgi:hypothetical protein
VPELRACEDRNDAPRRVPVFLRVRAVPRRPAAEGGGLLRVLLVRQCAVPAGPGRRRRKQVLLRGRNLTPVSRPRG